MDLALATRQPFSDVVRWHPRDVATAVDILNEASAEQRMEMARQRAQQMMSG